MADFAGKNVLDPGRQPGYRRGHCPPVRRRRRQARLHLSRFAGRGLALAKETGAEALKVDSADRRALTRAVADRGALDVIVISAGALVMGDPLSLDPDAVDHLIDVNVQAPYHAAVEAARRMPDGGRIIVIGSVNGDRAPFAGAARPTRSASRPCKAWCAAWHATSAPAASPSTPSSQARPTAT